MISTRESSVSVTSRITLSGGGGGESPALPQARVPQAKKEQSLKEVQASLKYRDYRQRLDEVAHRDAVIAEELTRKQESRLMAGNDVQYVKARDEAFACNLHRIEREYRKREARTLSQLAHDRRHVCRGHVRNLDTCLGLVT